MRSNYVSAAKYGKVLVYQFGQAVPSDLEQYFGTGDQTFRPDIIFDATRNRNRDDFVHVVKDSEDTDRFGNKECYPSDDMEVVVLFDAAEDATAEAIIADAKAKIPNFDNLFEVYISSN